MGNSVRIGNREVGDNCPTFVIAEIGINHNGSVEIAKQLIRHAVDAGCDAVKFQKRTVPIVYSKAELDKPRDVDMSILMNAVKRRALPAENLARLKDSNFEQTTNGDLKWALEFNAKEYAEIDRYCRELGILWFASPWDEESVDFLEQFDPPCYKVASPSLTDDQLLARIRSKGKPVLLSRGMSNEEMIRHAVGVLGTDELILLQCTSFYATVTATNEVLALLNLRAMDTLRRLFPEVPVGYSGNDAGIMPTYAAVARGACVVEKHITINHAMPGSDQASSLQPERLKLLVQAIRELPYVLGDGALKIYPEEIDVMKKLRHVMKPFY